VSIAETAFLWPMGSLLYVLVGAITVQYARKAITLRRTAVVICLLWPLLWLSVAVMTAWDYLSFTFGKEQRVARALRRAERTIERIKERHDL